MNSKQRKTLDAVFSTPVPASIAWTDILALFRALGADVDEGRSGSRVAVELKGEEASFHSPHRGRFTDRNAVRAVREFLENAGVQP